MGEKMGSKKPHAVCVPFPAQGHINPMMKLAKLLHSKGFHITFLNTEFNHKRLLSSGALTTRTTSLGSLPPLDFSFETIPGGLPIPPTGGGSGGGSTQHVRSLCEFTQKNCSAPFRQLLHRLNNCSSSSSNIAAAAAAAAAAPPPVSCIVSDGIMSFTLQASEELGIPNVLFWPNSACGLFSYNLCINLMERGIVPFKDSSYLTNGYSETTVEWIQGKKSIQMKHLPMIIRTTDPNDIILNFLKGQLERTSRASAIILHTFDALEGDVLDALSSSISPPKIFTIGPLQLQLDQQIKDDDNSNYNLDQVGSGLWKEEAECVEWLDSKEPNSVVYVNFGSLRVLTKEQVIELAWGLANSQQNFLWVIRPDLVTGGIELPKEFADETKERGLIASWCPQEQVLNHPPIGGFLTHCGWNSTIESITAGVPMICWPFSSEQRPNALYVCTEWEIGMAMDGGDDSVSRSEVEMLVRELVKGEKGKMMKNNVMAWRRMAHEATRPGGSSYLNLQRLVDEILLSVLNLVSKGYKFKGHVRHGEWNEIEFIFTLICSYV